jgi:3-deoxy-D-manno-octulosonic-acid transferase
MKFIIAPHSIKPERIKKLVQELDREVVLFSEKEGKDLTEYQVLIVDTVGLLSRIYSYADIAYVGGAAGNTGLHNILEPATFGVPVVIGKNFENFPEAHQLRRLAGLYSVSNSKELNEIFSRLLKDEKFRKKTGMIAGHFIHSNKCATKIFEDYLIQIEEQSS